MRSIVKELVYELMQMRAVPYPEIVVNKAKNCLLDYFGVAIAGSKEVQKKIAGRFDPLLYEAGKIKPIGFTDRTCLENAVTWDDDFTHPRYRVSHHTLDHLCFIQHKGESCMGW